MQRSPLILKCSGVGAARWLSGLVLLGTVAALTPAHAQPVYRIVGPDGKITFSDKPPGAAAKGTGLETSTAASPGGSALPYELRQVADKYPVVLYTSRDCAPCDSGRSLLRGRGVPFAEKTVTSSDDAESLQRLSGSTSLPFLTIGGQQIKGFSDAEWVQYLTAAGYPEKSKLPTGYRNPQATPLVAVKQPDAAAPGNSVPTAEPIPAGPPRVNSSNPAGIQF